MKKAGVFVALGGSGVIGQGFATKIKATGTRYVSFSLSQDSDDGHWRNIQLDLKACDPRTIELQITSVTEGNALGIVDFIGLLGESAEAVAKAATSLGCSVGIISSCLLYDHDASGPVDESWPTVSSTRAKFPYHRTKAQIEEQWRSGTFTDWVIFRLHHILGAGSLLGCIPNHNRDPNLLNILHTQAPLQLALGGQVKLSYIHPQDLAGLAIKILTSGKMSGRAVNLVHPDPVCALEYYMTIARQLGISMPIVETINAANDDFWHCTARDNIYVSQHDAVNSHNFTHDISDCIHDALSIDAEKYSALGAHLRERVRGN